MSKDFIINKEYSFLKLGLQIIFIFSIPLIAVFLISYLFKINIFYLLPISFVSSWIGIIFLYKKSMEYFEKNKIDE